MTMCRVRTQGAGDDGGTKAQVTSGAMDGMGVYVVVVMFCAYHVVTHDHDGNRLWPQGALISYALWPCLTYAMCSAGQTRAEAGTPSNTPTAWGMCVALERCFAIVSAAASRDTVPAY